MARKDATVITQKQLIKLFADQAPKWADVVDAGLLPKNGIAGLYWPDEKAIFRALADRDPDDVRYIVVGQDPYFGARGTSGKKPMATGLAFDIHDDCHELPPSLKNIVSHIAPEQTESAAVATHAFRRWVENHKVLMLNAALTVERGKPGSHLGVWKDFLSDVIQVACKRSSGVKVVAWGSKARDLVCAAMVPEVAFTYGGHPQGRNGTESFDKFWETPVGRRLTTRV
jgi:uracil-DNA glycosylase